MSSSYEDIMGTPMDPGDHPAYNKPDATEHHEGTQLADVVPLHPPGTFSRNTDGGDSVNAVAKGLGMPPPKNILPFKKK